MIVVLDTNVLVSGLHFSQRQGTPTRAIEKAMAQDVIATCRQIEDELLRVLTQKFSWESFRVEAALKSVLARSLQVEIYGAVLGCRDP